MTEPKTRRSLEQLAGPNEKGTPVASPVRKAMGLHEIARPPQGT